MAAALEAEAEAATRTSRGRGRRRTPRRRGRRRATSKPRAGAAAAAAGAAGAAQPAGARPLEGTFDHGDEGYGLWLDPAVQDDPVYAEHWAGHRPVDGHGRGRAASSITQRSAARADDD